MSLSRRLVLTGGLALCATPLRAAGTVPPPAAALVQPVPGGGADISALLINREDGTKANLADWRGRWVILNFWAPWCVPCRLEMPSLDRLSAQLDPPDQAVLLPPLAVDQRGVMPVRKFYADIGLTHLPIFLGEPENMNAVMGTAKLPTTAIIDPEGGRHVFTVAGGEAQWDDPLTAAWLSRLMG